MPLLLFRPPEPVKLAVPHRQQAINGDCLAICVEMVLTYLRVSYSPTQVARTLTIQPNVGTPFPNIRALEKLNILVGYRRHGTLEMLYTLL